MPALPMQSSPRMPQGVPDDVGALLLAARSGDRAALDEIVRRCYERVERAVHQRLQFRFRNSRWISTAFSTGDIVHGVFLKVLSGPLKLEHSTEETLIAYLVKMIENQIVDTTRFHEASRRDVRREDRRRPSAPDPVAQTPAQCGTPSREARENEHLAIYAETLQSFTGRERTLLKMRLENHQSFDDIAKQLGFKSADVARKAFHAAKSKLLVKLIARGVDPDAGGGADRG